MKTKETKRRGSMKAIKQGKKKEESKRELFYDVKKIREVRESQKLSQMDIAVKTGLSLITIWNIENGTKEPRISTLTKISKALGKPVSFFVTP